MGASSTIYVQNKTKLSVLQPWIVVFTASLFFFFEFVQMNMFGSINQSIMKEFNISATQLGNLSATYFYANVLFLFIAGISLDKFSTRRLIMLAMSICVISTYIFAMAHTLWLAQICRFITGIASTVTLLSCVRLASRWFPPRRLALVLGLVVTMAMVGGMIAQTPMALLTSHMGWRYAVMINSTAGLFFIVLIFCFVKDSPKHFKEVAHHHTLPLKQGIQSAIKNPQNWLAGIYTNLLSLPIVLLGALWGTMYLQQMKGLSHIQAANVSSFIYIGIIIGSPLLGWLSDQIGRRKWPMIAGGILTLITFLIILFTPAFSYKTLMMLFFLLGFFCSTQVITYALLAETNPISITATAEGIACTIIMSAGAIFQPLYGWVMDHFWQQETIQGFRLYPAESYHYAMLLVVIAFIVSIIISFFIKETYCELHRNG